MGDPINQVPGHPIPSGWIGMPALPADHSGKSLPSSSHRHPNQHCPRFQVFGVYDGDDDHFVIAVQEFDEQERAERVARKLMNRCGYSGGMATAAPIMLMLAMV
jgi:hypothetical protein